MSCKDIDILLQLAVDDEITDAERRAIDSHLEGCVTCRRKEAWLDLLSDAYPAAATPALEMSDVFADAVVAALGVPRDVSTDSAPETVSITKSKVVKKAKEKKRGIFAKMVSAFWTRRKQKRAKAKAQKEKETRWIGASVTSLDTFRAAKQGVSTTMRAFNWVSGILPKRGR